MPDDGFTAARGPAAGRLIDRYELIAQASHEMLAAARHGDWESVARLEDACSALIAELQCAAVSDRLAQPEQRRRVALLRAILADDAEIRARAEPWLQQLEHLIRPPAPRAGGNAPRS
ncbi:MAG: flagellar protein FliT [Burkholderiaceae bacterium]|nr:flagellar protein FliT [Burkholderiaceae bacterium]